MDLTLEETRPNQGIRSSVATLSLPKRCNITPRNVHERFQTLLTPVLTLFTDFLSAVVTSEIAQILSLYGGESSEVAKLKWFCFDLALKLALYTYKKKKKKKKPKSSHNTLCVTCKAK